MKNSKSRNSARNKYSRKYNKKNSTSTRRITTGGKSGSNLASVLLSDLNKMADKSLNRKGSPNKTAVDDLVKIEKNIGDGKGSPADGKEVDEVINDAVEDISGDTNKIDGKVKSFVGGLSNLSSKDIIGAFDTFHKKIKDNIAHTEKKYKDIKSTLSTVNSELEKSVIKLIETQTITYNSYLDFFKKARDELSKILLSGQRKTVYLFTIFGYLINFTFFLTVVDLLTSEIRLVAKTLNGVPVSGYFSTSGFIIGHLLKALRYLIPPPLFTNEVISYVNRGVWDIVDETAYFNKIEGLYGLIAGVFIFKTIMGMIARGLGRKIFGKVNKDVKK
jgi:preprotein translocase subunit SecE